MERRNFTIPTVAYLDLVMTVEGRREYLFLLKCLHNNIVIKYNKLL